MEFTISIPGSVGGAVRMNAGAHGSEVADRLRSTLIFDVAAAGLIERKGSDLDFSYRHSNLTDSDIVVAATFELSQDSPKAIKERMETYRKHRAETQPGAVQNAGSVFRNPPGDHAARLIEACGLKGFTVGGAQVSRKHSNFIVNAGGASARDIESVIEHVHATVLRDKGVDLVREVRIVGDAA